MSPRMPLLIRLFLALAIIAALLLLGGNNTALRQQLSARADEVTLLKQEARALHQQLEAERILSFAQSAMLKKATSPATSTAAEAGKQK